MKLIKNIFKRKPALLYRKCNELPIHNFNEVANNSDFSYLKINRNDVVRDEDLQLAWLDILDEYLTISKNNFALALIKRKSKLILLEKKLRVLEAMNLCVEYGVDIDAELAQYRIKKDKVAVNIGMVKNDINRISNSVPDETERKQSNTDFDRSIAMLNKNGFNINRFTTVVSEWVQALNILEKQHEANKNQ